MEILIEVKNVSKQFPGVKALDSVSMSVARGEIHALVGQNGAGKSTLSKIIAGVYSQDQGEIIFDGKSMDLANPREALDYGIAVIYQELSLVPSLNVAENIYLGRWPHHAGRVRWKEMHQSAEVELQKLGLHIDTLSRISDIGAAERQMVEITKAVSRSAQLIIMDEPTSSLTPDETVRLFNLITMLKDKGVTIIYISHRLEEIFQLCDRVTVFRDGRHISTEKTNEVGIDDIIHMMVGKRVSSVRHDYTTRVIGPEKRLEVKELSRKGLLNGISFAVRQGEVVGLAGPVGSGRTELLRAIFGADRIDSGAILVDGREHVHTSPGQAIQNKIGFVPEDRKAQGLVLTMRVRENISLGCLALLSRLGRIIGTKEKEQTNRYIEYLHIATPSGEQGVRFLSGGNQQKVVLARWLSTECDILLLDEPTRGIDVGAKQEIYQIIDECTLNGSSVLVVSSDLQELLRLSDRILVMSEGQITAELPREEATEERILSLF